MTSHILAHERFSNWYINEIFNLSSLRREGESTRRKTRKNVVIPTLLSGEHTRKKQLWIRILKLVVFLHPTNVVFALSNTYTDDHEYRFKMKVCDYQ